MSVRQSLGTVTLADLAEFVGLPRLLLVPPDRRDNQPLRTFLGHLAGQVSWSSYISERLELAELERALEAAVEAERRREPVDPQVIAKLRGAVQVSCEKIAHDRVEQSAVLATLPAAWEFSEDVKRTAARLETLQLPSTDAGWVEASTLLRAARAELESITADVKSLRELFEEELQGRREQLLKATERAFSHAMALIREGSPRAGRIVLDQLSGLVERKSQERLAELALLPPGEIEARYGSVTVPYAFTLKQHPAVSPRPRKPRMDAGTLLTNLQVLSRAIYAKATPGPRGAEESPIRELEAQIALLRNRERASAWLSAAKATGPDLLKLPLIGRGLLHEGLTYVEEALLNNARRVLRDSFLCLAAADDPLDEVAARALMVSVAWPVRSKTNDRDQGTPAEWLESPRMMQRNVTTENLLVVIARLWANELLEPALAGRFLEICDAEIGAGSRLLARCAEELLAPVRLTREADRNMALLASLLPDAGPEAELLRNAGDKLNAMDFATAKVDGAALKQLASDISRGLEPGADRNPVVASIHERLPRLLERLAESSTPSGGEVTLQVLARNVFPEERPRDLELPLLIRNSTELSAEVEVALTNESSVRVTIGNSRIELGTIPAWTDREAIFELALPENTTNKATELRLKVELRVNERNRHETFTVQVKPGNRAYRNSPYTAGTEVSSDGSLFVGREKELRQFVGMLTSNARNIPLVVGIRRIGKTSLLKRALADPEIKRRYSTIYWDVEDWEEHKSTADLLLYIAEKCRGALHPDMVGRIPFSREDFRTDPFHAFEHFVQDITAAPSARSILIAIDEFDHLLNLTDRMQQRARNERFTLDPTKHLEPTVFAALRKAIMSSSKFNLAVCGLSDILKKTTYEARFFGLMSPIRINEMTETEAEQILEAGKPIMEFTPLARDAILRATGKQPYLLQVVCQALFARMARSGRDLVTPYDVRDVIETHVLPMESYFVDYESLAGDDRPILYGLARALKRAVPKDYVSVREVSDALAQEGVERSAEDIRRTLDQLAPRSPEEGDRPLVLRAPNRPDRFRLSIGMLAQRLLKAGYLE